MFFQPHACQRTFLLGVHSSPQIAPGRCFLMFRWAIEGKLAGGPRPRIPHKHLSQVPRSIVDEWIKQAKANGIRSVICLLDESQLWLYKNLPRDLVSYYQAS